ncbi:MAG TPA: DUF1385 domain-containing protein [Thermoanaerobaculia bacterium]|jgi:uncharacterized protein YqhQ|nr:DUF1385 domain-containing protein [Thermoanaerobaculia bacterium]
MRSSNSPEGELLVGGQALIEGVMMRSPGAYGVAVRRPDGSIAFQRGKVASLARRYPFLKLPILRGVAVLFQSLALGIRSLNFSAEQAMPEAEKKAEAAQDAKATGDNGDKSNWAIAGSMAVGLGLGAVVFLLVPLWLTRLSETYLFGSLSSLAFNLVDGALRALFFLAYIFLISRMKDIHRVFQYHGAEHKVVFAWEKQVPLTVENARAQSRLHPRCGTSFLLFVLLVSILVFSFIPKTLPFLLMYGGRLLLVPVIAGLSYEVLRFTAKHQAAPLFALLVAPGLALQRITTQEPTDDMLEVAIAALEEALREDGILQDHEMPRTAADPVAVAAAGA